MYEFIKGRLTEKNPAYAVIESNGIGYLLNISLHTYSQMKEDEHCTLYTHLVVREDAMILSSVPPAEVIQAIVLGDAPFLQRIKGIGSKTAQRLIIDLKDKLSRELLPYEKLPGGYNTKKEEALSGLIILGFSKMVAEKALAKVIEQEGTALPVEQLIRHALKIL